MNNRGQVNIGMIIMLFIGIVVVAGAFLPTIFNTQNQLTDKQDVLNQSVSTVTGYLDDSDVNEAINYSIYTQSTWKVSSCPLTSVVIRNGAGTVLADDTDYTLDEANARYSLLNTTKTIPVTALNLTYVDYSYCADGYNTSSGGRTTAKLIGLFAALALLAFVTLGVKEWAEIR